MRFALALSLLAAGCAGPRSGAPRAQPLHPDAPGWARDGDRTDDGGHTFVCEGSGATGEEAQAAALAACAAKICNLCGVEVEAVVEATESLDTVAVKRRVVERCRRVRKGADDLRRNQSACAPEGCVGWVEVAFSKEAEAHECKAYASESFADPEQCEALIEQFRRVPGLSSIAFDTRADLLTRAIVACAEIDVRPTPRMQALDAVLYEGVLAPALEESTVPRPAREGPLGERLRQALALRADEALRELSKRAYQPMPRQPLIETKIFVDRVARVRDEMAGYAGLMRVWEKAIRISYQDEGELPAFFAAMEALRPFAEVDPRVVHFRVLEVVAPNCRRRTEISAWLRQRYPAATLGADELEKAAELLGEDREVTDEEWTYLLQGKLGWRVLRTVILAAAPSDEEIRLQRFLAGVAAIHASHRDPNRGGHLGGLLDLLSPTLVERVAAALPPAQQALVTWNRLDDAVYRLPVGEAGRATPTFAALTARMWAMTRARDGGGEEDRCNDLEVELRTLESRGVDTRELLPAVCACITRGGARRINEVAEHYVRALAWKAPCVTGRAP
jgi:hypothetical protein